MGTRADFYIGQGEEAVWLGSVGWDGYPKGITPKSEETEKTWNGARRHIAIEWPQGEHLFDSENEEEFLARVQRYFQYRADVTLPEHGWPWPWDDSNTTDYAYSFHDGKVMASCFGSDWFDPREDYSDDEIEQRGEGTTFPNMKGRKNVAWGERSGLIFVGG
jgi:hypothetical protein